MQPKYKHIPVIINPASGQPQTVLYTLSEVFRKYNQPWDALVTQAGGQAKKFAEDALKEGAEVVVVYGGDGTLLEVINAVMGSGVPVGLLAGGTGNGVVRALDIPLDLRKEVEMICTSDNVRGVDVAQANEHYFMLRILVGIPSDMMASREDKDQYGKLAYPRMFLQMISEGSQKQYRVEVDGEQMEVQAGVCFVNNLPSLGGVPFELGTITPDDGLFDVLLLDKTRESFKELVSYAMSNEDLEGAAYHSKGSVIRIEADPPQDLWLDGELRGTTPVEITNHRQAISVIVPQVE